MKPEELFYGMLVLHGRFSDKCRITGIDRAIHNDNYDWFLHYDVMPSERSYTGWLSEIKPIPLTFEFMTKNFPKPDIVIWNPGAVDNNHCFYCEVGGEDSKKSISGDFYYVHELQHALCLCGINKEIEL